MEVTPCMPTTTPESFQGSFSPLDASTPVKLCPSSILGMVMSDLMEPDTEIPAIAAPTNSLPVTATVPEPANCPEETKPQEVPETTTRHPDVAACMARLEREDQAPLPWYALSGQDPSFRQVMVAALKDDEKFATLKQVLFEKDFVLLSQNEFREAKTEARRRGREEQETSLAPNTSGPAELTKAWQEGEAEPVGLRKGRWALIPQQVNVGGLLLHFDLRMRAMEVPKTVAPVPKPKVKKSRRKPALTPVLVPSHHFNDSGSLPTPSTPPAATGKVAPEINLSPTPPPLPAVVEDTTPEGGSPPTTIPDGTITIRIGIEAYEDGDAATPITLE